MEKQSKKLPKGISLRNDGRYMGRLTYHGESITVYGTTATEAKKKLDDKRYELEHGIFCKETDISVHSWFETWIREYKSITVKKGTLTTYSYTYNTYIDNVLGKKKLRDVRAEHIQKLYNDMYKNGYSRNTIEIVSIVLGGMYKQAFKNELISKNPVPLATLPKYTSAKEKRVLSKDEQQLFLEYAKESKYANIFEFALYTGMRSGEIRALTWDNIDFNKKIIYIRGTLVRGPEKIYIDSPKTSSSYRTIPMLDNVYAILKNQRLWQSEMRIKIGQYWKPLKDLENLVFTTETGSPVGKENLKNCINRTVRRINDSGIGFQHISMHTFRHSFATRCIENGMNPQTLKAILGHSKLSMTMDLYAHVLPDTKAEEIQKIANLF